MIMQLNSPEIRRPTLDIHTQALVDDSRVREIDKIVRESWSELAAISIRVRDKQLWKLLPQKFHSFDDWLIDAAPVCRATVYRGMGILSTIASDLSPEDIAGIEIGNASLLAQLSPGVRRDPDVIEAAKSGRHTKKLRDVVKAKFPDQHLEDMHEEKLRWPESAWAVIEEAFEAYRQFEDETITLPSWVEWMANNYMDSPNVERPNVSNRQALRSNG